MKSTRYFREQVLRKRPYHSRGMVDLATLTPVLCLRSREPRHDRRQLRGWMSRRPYGSLTSHCPFAFQLFRLVVRHQGLDDWLQLAVDHFLQLMDGQPNAVVGDAVLREIVRAYLFAAIARTHHRFAFFCQRLLLLLHLHFVKSGTQNAHGLFAILDL